MKKIISLLMTVAMMVSTASVAFAADCNFNLSPSATSVTPGETITFTVKLDSNPGMAYFKNIIEFNEDVFERVPYIYEVIEDEEVVEEIEYDVYSTWGSITCNDAQDDKTIMVWSNSSNKTSKTMLKINYQVKDDAVNGTYDFTVKAEEILNANGGAVSVTPSTASITVTGGKEPVQDTVKATATFGEEKQEGTVYGLKGSIAANDQTVTGVTFKVNNGEKDGNVNATFTQAIAKDSNVTFGVNITGIPSGITLGYVADSLAPVAE